MDLNPKDYSRIQPRQQQSRGGRAVPCRRGELLLRLCGMVALSVHAATTSRCRTPKAPTRWVRIHACKCAGLRVVCVVRACARASWPPPAPRPRLRTAHLEVRELGKDLRLAAQRGASDRCAGGQACQVLGHGRDEDVAHVLAGQVAGQDGALGQVRGHVLRTRTCTHAHTQEGSGGGPLMTKMMVGAGRAGARPRGGAEGAPGCGVHACKACDKQAELKGRSGTCDMHARGAAGAGQRAGHGGGGLAESCVSSRSHTH